MGQVDRIPPISPVILQSLPASHVEARKEGRQQGQDPKPHDVLELHETEEETTEPELILEVVEAAPEHGLDLTA